MVIVEANKIDIFEWQLDVDGTLRALFDGNAGYVKGIQANQIDSVVTHWKLKCFGVFKCKKWVQGLFFLLIIIEINYAHLAFNLITLLAVIFIHSVSPTGHRFISVAVNQNGKWIFQLYYLLTLLWIVSVFILKLYKMNDFDGEKIKLFFFCCKTNQEQKEFKLKFVILIGI